MTVPLVKRLPGDTQFIRLLPETEFALAYPHRHKTSNVRTAPTQATRNKVRINVIDYPFFLYGYVLHLISMPY